MPKICPVFLFILLSVNLVYGSELQIVTANDTERKGLVLEYHSFPDSSGLLRSAWIGDICPVREGVYIANCGLSDAPYEGGLTFYNPSNKFFKHFWGKCAIFRPYKEPPHYEPNTPLPCNFVKRILWDGNRLWIIPGGQGSFHISCPYTPYFGLFTFDGEKWQNMKKKAIDLTLIENEIFVQVIDTTKEINYYGQANKLEIYDLNRKDFTVWEDFAYLLNYGVHGDIHITGDTAVLFFSGYVSFPVKRHKEMKPVLYCYNRRDHKWSQIKNLNAKRVENIYWDGHYLWVCGYYQNVERYDPITKSWSHNLFGSNIGTRRESMQLANCLVKYGQYLIVGFEGQPPLGIIDTQTGATRIVNNPKWICGTYIHELVLDNSTLWIGTHGSNGGLTRLDLNALLHLAFKK